MPKDIQSHLPSETAPITTLLKNNTPALLPTTLILRPVHLYTSPLELNWSIDKLLKTPIPPRTWMRTLEEIFSQLWTTGTHSIGSPLSSNLDLWFPLWVMSFWYVAVEVAEQKDKRNTAENRLSQRVQDSETHRAKNLLEKVPRELRLWSLIGNDQVCYLAGLFSDD